MLMLNFVVLAKAELTTNILTLTPRPMLKKVRSKHSVISKSKSNQKHGWNHGWRSVNERDRRQIRQAAKSPQLKSHTNLMKASIQAMVWTKAKVSTVYHQTNSCYKDKKQHSPGKLLKVNSQGSHWEKLINTRTTPHIEARNSKLTRVSMLLFLKKTRKMTIPSISWMT